MFEIIDESAMEFTPRGRKSNVPQELVNALKGLKTGMAVRLTDKAFTVSPKSETAKTDRARISAMIRSAGKIAGVEVSIKWSPIGVPQVVTSKPAK